MRFSIIATALTAASFATAQVDVAQNSADGTTSAMTTWTLTRTVERVVQTVTATRNGTQVPLTTTTSSVVMPLASASLSITPYVNGTASVWGTGAGPTGASQTGRPVSGGNRVAAAGVLCAMVGVAGLVIL